MLLGEVKIFLISGGKEGLSNDGKGIFRSGRSVHFPSIFSFSNTRFHKFIFLPEVPSCLIFIFSGLRQMQDFK